MEGPKRKRYDRITDISEHVQIIYWVNLGMEDMTLLRPEILVFCLLIYYPKVSKVLRIYSEKHYEYFSELINEWGN